MDSLLGRGLWHSLAKKMTGASQAIVIQFFVASQTWLILHTCSLSSGQDGVNCYWIIILVGLLVVIGH